ncbi:MAG: hypothetical protein AB7G62_01510 [Magnetospirillum sp.]
MNRIAVICVAMAGLALSACAADPQPQMSAPAKRMVTPPGGQWEVTEALAVAPTGSNNAPYMGQKLSLYDKSAIDPAGRSCDTPVYMGWEAAPASVLGDSVKGGEARPVMEVTCKGEAFGTYVGMADGSLMTRVNDWVLTLNRAAPEMAQALEPVKMPEPVKVVEPEPAKPEPAKMAEPDKRTIVYLASYPSDKKAQAGWKVLAKKSPILAKQQPIFTHVDLPKKGKWVRLYGLASDEAERATICKQVGKAVDECGSRLRE